MARRNGRIDLNKERREGVGCTVERPKGGNSKRSLRYRQVGRKACQCDRRRERGWGKVVPYNACHIEGLTRLSNSVSVAPRRWICHGERLEPDRRDGCIGERSQRVDPPVAKLAEIGQVVGRDVIAADADLLARLQRAELRVLGSHKCRNPRGKRRRHRCAAEVRIPGGVCTRWQDSAHNAVTRCADIDKVSEVGIE